ncbi:MAG TPA: putative sugar nucleotidyl transferase [Gemmatimonadales bacterium]|jgi:UDP-N-acetylglucosamine diphosphorylase/glucosamine-1-phosphate N-acetyltransferase|nr:putative sugar nucleotidyl transferase [Gemmatimonadales bacterium]
MQLVLLEPDDADGGWAPFAGVRPVAELRAGAWRIRERWERALGLQAGLIMGSRVNGFVDVDTPIVAAPAQLEGPVIIAASDFAPATERLTLGTGVTRLVAAGRTVARVIPEGSSRPSLEGDGSADEIGGLWLSGTDALLTALELLLPGDCRAARAASECPAGALILGDKADVKVGQADVEPGVVFDVRHGSVVIQDGAEVRSGTRLEGPCWIGEHARVVGGFIRQSVIGPHAVVRGEVSSSIFTGYCNKAHDGFVGHTILGHWVNLGALTTTSNLKNTYGSVRVETPAGPRDTGRQFVGSFIGDHAKTAIGTMLSTGTIIGAGASVFGDGRPPKWVPPFAWGNGCTERLSEAGFLETARRVMPRRHIEVTPERAAWLAALHRSLA